MFLSYEIEGTRQNVLYQWIELSPARGGIGGNLNHHPCRMPDLRLHVLVGQHALSRGVVARLVWGIAWNSYLHLPNSHEETT